MSAAAEDYRWFIDQVYGFVQKALGGDPEQGGSGRKYGDAVFYHDAVGVPGDPSTWSGDVDFTIDYLPADALKRQTRRVRIEWRAFLPDPQKAAQILIDAYERLSAGGGRRSD